MFRSKRLLIACFLLAAVFSSTAYAQKIDTVSTFSITGYVDAYYAYYTDSVGPGNFQKFPTVCPRSNSPSLNIAQLTMQYNADKVRAMAAFHFGDIPAATWAAPPYRPIMEAHVGYKIYSKLWVDAGFFRTHFGTEFLLPSENITSSVSIGTFYEPYYESGIRLNFDPTKKLEINLFLLNGYGIFVDNNNKKSFGMGITYALGENSGIGYTNYIGDESLPGDPARLRVHQNVFLNYQRRKVKLQVGGDYCMQEKSDIATASKTAYMYTALATFRYQVCKSAGIYGRGELLSDPDGWMTGIIKDYSGKLTGLKLWGFTVGAEYKPTEESYIKLEGRVLQMDKDQYIFTYNSELQNKRFEIMLNAGVTFDLLRSIKTKVTGPSDLPGEGHAE